MKLTMWQVVVVLHMHTKFWEKIMVSFIFPTLVKWKGRRQTAPQNIRDGFNLYSAQASFAWQRVDLARPLRRKDFRPFWIIFIIL